MARSKDIIGQRFGRLVVVREIIVPYTGIMKNRKTYKRVECKCDCGNTIFPHKSNILSGYSKACTRCAIANNLVGKRIGKIEFLERVWDDTKIPARLMYKIKCDCGNVFFSRSQTAARLKGIKCAKCPRKPPPMTMDEAAKLRGTKKHLDAIERKIGQVSGRLTLLKFQEWRYANGRRYAYYLFKCKCGKKIIRKGDIIGTIFSCGCLHLDNILKGEESPCATLKNEDAAAIRELIKTGLYTQRQIAKMYNVDDTRISAIKKNKVYKT